MKTKETRSENVKIRLTPGEKEVIETQAQKEKISYSDFIRHALFGKESSSSSSIAIQYNLIKNEMMNRIQSMDIPDEIRKNL